MHFLNIATLLIVVSLVGAELSVSAFVDPTVWRLDREPQLHFLSRYAAVLGKVMPFWYSGSLVLLGLETWFYRQTPAFGSLLAATILWIVSSVASFIFLVPLNNRVAKGIGDWQSTHRTWDRRHQVRVLSLFLAALLLAFGVVR